MLVTPVNDNPDAQGDSASVAEDNSILIDVLANDSDLEGDSLSIASVGSAANGTVAIESGQVRYTPNADFNGNDSFTYTISDGNGGTDTATVNVLVTPVNDAPVANDDSASALSGSPVNADVLVNDFDVDGDSLAVSIISGPSNGSAVIEADGSITYTPNAGYTGNDSLTYQIDDGNGGTDTAVLNITINAAVGQQLWGVDQDDGQLFAFTDYENPLAAGSFQDYGNLLYLRSDGQLIEIGTDIEAFAIDANGIAYMAINRDLEFIPSHGDDHGGQDDDDTNDNANKHDDLYRGHHGRAGSFLARIDLSQVGLGGGNVIELVGQIGSPYGHSVSGLSFDPISGQLYGLSKQGSIWAADRLIVIDAQDAHIVDTIGRIKGLGERVGSGEALQFDSDGNLYVTDNVDDELYRISTNSARILEIIDRSEEGGLGVSHVKFEGLAFDSQAGKLIGTDTTNDLLAELRFEDGNNRVIGSLSSLGLTDVEGIDFLVHQSGGGGSAEGSLIKLDSLISEFVEGSDFERLVKHATIMDNGLVDYDGETLEVSFADGAGTINDRLTLIDHGDITISGNDIYFQGALIGSFSGGSSGNDPLLVTFNAAADKLSIAEVIESLAYQNASEDPSEHVREIELTLTNSSGVSSNIATKQLEVEAINDKPEIHGIDDIDDIQAGTDTLIENNGETVTVSDVDAESDDMLYFKLAVKQGVLNFDLSLLNLNSASELESVLGVDFVRGDGVNDSRLAFYATVDSANQLFSALTYTNETGRDDRLFILMDDLGNGGGHRRRDIDIIRLFVDDSGNRNRWRC